MARFLTRFWRYLFFINILVKAESMSTTVPAERNVGWQTLSSITAAPELSIGNDLRRREDHGTLSDITGYGNLRYCAKNCLVGAFGGLWGIWQFTDCETDECACRPDSHPIVDENLSSCIKAQCPSSDTEDYTIATNVYNLFCNSVIGTQSNLQPTSGGGLASTVTVTAKSTVTVTTSASSKYTSESVMLIFLVRTKTILLRDFANSLVL